MTHTLRIPQSRDAIFYWLAFAVAAFALLPAFSLDYGLLEASRAELLAAYGWSGLNISTLWFTLPLLLLFRPLSPAGREQRSRHYFDAGYALFCALFVVVTSAWLERGLGFATIGLFIALGAIITLALARLEWLGATALSLGHW